jgi:hypothetical protein
MVVLAPGGPPFDTELQELNEQKKEVFAEAKGEGFDVNILKEIIKTSKAGRAREYARSLHARHGAGWVGESRQSRLMK